MLNIKTHVTSLPLSRQLKEAGVKQESLLYHVKHRKWEQTDNGMKEVDPEYKIESWGELTNSQFYSAFLASEVLDLLPKHVQGHVIQICPGFKEGGWFVGHGDHMNLNGWHVEDGKNLADAAAKQLLHLIQSGVVKTNV